MPPMDVNQICKDWVQSRGADVEHVVVAPTNHPDERCLQVAKPLREQQRLMTLPEACFINTYAIRRTPLGERLQAAEVDHRHGLLVGFLLDESAKPDSPWAPYFATLPQSFAHLPNTQLAQLAPVLQGTWALQFMMLDARITLHSYQRTAPILPHLKLDLARYTWAAMAVRTRTFSGALHDEKVSMMVPLADMLNHGLEADVIWSAIDRPPGFAMMAMRPLKPGREVLTSYGEKSNSILFARYGFMLDGNPLREAVLQVRSDTPISGVKMAMLHGPGPYTFAVVPDMEHEQTIKALSCLRILNATDEQVSALMERNVPSDMTPPIDVTNEAQARTNFVQLSNHARRRLEGQLASADALPEFLRKPARTILEEEISVHGWFESHALSD